MSVYRAIYQKIWKDPDFQNYSPEGKLLFIYLCTNESTTESGIYPITHNTISAETSITLQSVSKLLDNGLKNVIYDIDNHCVFVKRFRRYNAGGRTDLIKKSIHNDYKANPHTKLWEEFTKEYPEFTSEIHNSCETVDKQLVNPVQTIPSKGSGSGSSKGNPNPISKGSGKDTKNNNEEIVFTIYQNNFGLISSPYIVEELKIISQDYPERWFEEAVKEAFMSSKGGKPNLNYIKSILERWLRDGKNNKSQEQIKPISKFNDGWNTGL